MTARILCTLILLLCTGLLHAQDDLDQYIARLRKSEKEGGKETAFMSPGSEFLYGQGNFDSKNYFSAASNFKRVVEAQPDNAFAHYQLAIALIRQKEPAKEVEAQKYLQQAFQLLPSLRERYARDVPTAAGKVVKDPRTEGDGLNRYIATIRHSWATGGTENAMNAPGQEVHYGLGYFDKGEYESAASRFRLARARAEEHPYINYLLGLSLITVNNKDGEIYMAQALAADPALRSRLAADKSEAARKHTAYQKSRAIVTGPEVVRQFGGKLKTGTYTCNEMRYTPNKVGSQYTPIPKGSFTLSPSGTYQYLKNGTRGNYKYDAKTGRITWLSGYFKNAGAINTEYQSNGQITVHFTDTYRWECGCNQ